MGPIESVASRQAPAQSRQPPRQGWTLALTSVAFFMVALDALVVITALPAIGRDLGGGIATLEWTVNAYTLTFAAGIIPAAATAVFAANGQLGTPASFTAGFRPALALAAGFSLLGVVSALAVGGRRHPPATTQPQAPVAAALNEQH